MLASSGRLIKLTIMTMVSLALPTGATAAQLFQDVNQFEPLTQQLQPTSPTVKKRRDIIVNIDLLTRDTERLELNVFPGETLIAVKTRFDINPHRNITIWYGKLVTEKITDDSVVQTQVGTVVFVIRNGRVQGTIHHNSETYSLKPTFSGGHEIKHINPAGFPPDHCELDPTLNGRVTSHSHIDTTHSQHDLADDLNPTAEPTGINTIRVMVAYSSTAKNNSPDINGEIELAVAASNSSYMNNAIDDVIALELVHTYEYGPNETGDMHADLDNFRDDPSVHFLRDKYQADVVILVERDADVCGTAYGIGVQPRDAYAAVKLSCLAEGRYTFPHEIGHLQGARHQPSYDSKTTPFSYGHGYEDPGNGFRSIMARSCENATCTRIPYWSSTTVHYNNHSLGDPVWSNNARVMVETAATAASFWQPSHNNGDPVSDIAAEFELDNGGTWVGGNISFTARFRNQGPDLARNLAARIRIPGDVDLDSFTPSGLNCSVTLNEINCSAGQVPVNGSVSVRVVTSTNNNTATFPYSISAYSDSFDSNIANNDTARMLGGQNNGADIQVSMTGSTRTVNNRISVNVNIINNGPSPADSVGLVMSSPSSTALLDASHPNCDTFGGVENQVSCSIGTLMPNQTTAITFNYSAPARQKVSVTAEATSPTHDAILSNNTLTKAFGGSFSIFSLALLMLLVVGRRVAR